jgi:CRISPR/Cas system-associated exonuclease Cas4 (RecB family)
MSDGNKAIVVDYKLGEPVPGKYNRQVASYMSDLEKAGFTVVEGYIWYLTSNSVEKVVV